MIFPDLIPGSARPFRIPEPRHPLACSRLVLGFCLVVGLASPLWAQKADPKGALFFSRRIRPILSRACFACHGPDDGHREAGLRLDQRESAVASRSGSAAVVPASRARSLLWQRITSADPKLRMPPAERHPALTPKEQDLIGQWIDRGARYAPHWSLVAPRRVELPPVEGGRAHNPIDHFVLARLRERGLQAAPPEDPHRLIRRLSLDLCGLPPTPEETRRFAANPSDEAYRAFVRELLARPAFGERWASLWLDLARYADSAGFGSDPLRPGLWRWRDWVVDAFNQNLPFDEFTTAQIAGDLRPGATPREILPTAFHRNTMTNTEGGTDDEEFRVAAVKDRANTTAQVWMGLSFQCAQCHSHKYDPISQREYYAFTAFFDQTEDSDRADEHPRLFIPTPEEERELAELDARLLALRERRDAPDPELDQRQREWEKELAEPEPWVPFVPRRLLAKNGTRLKSDAEGRILATRGEAATDRYELRAMAPWWSGQEPRLRTISALRLEALHHPSLPNSGPGLSEGNGNFVLNDLRVTIRRAAVSAPLARFVRLRLPGRKRMLHIAELEVESRGANRARGARVSQSSTDFGGEAQRAVDGERDGRYEQGSVTHTAQEEDPWLEVDLGREMPLDAIRVFNRADGLESRLDGVQILAFDARRELCFTTWFDRPGARVEVRPGVDSSRALLRRPSASFQQKDYGVAGASDRDPRSGWAISPNTGRSHTALFPLDPLLPLQPGDEVAVELGQDFGSGHLLGHFRIEVLDERAPRPLLDAALMGILAKPTSERTAREALALRRSFRRAHGGSADLERTIASLEKRRKTLRSGTTPILRELPEGKRRTTHVLIKGSFLTKGEVVTAGVPAALPSLPKGPRDRRALAAWLVDPGHPLTARVTVNRFWSRLFGRGLVSTEEDFGSQGALPTHPDLLDWLAVEFVASGWDLKGLLETMVTSATYRQAVRGVPGQRGRDPENLWLARGPRQRLSAEMVRDQALFVSGLLNPKRGGPSVFPAQPAGLWQAAFNGQRRWPTSKGAERHRRGLYTFLRRTMPYPSMSAFDAPSRELCTSRRLPTNTPLQALVSWNDPVFVEAAEALAQRMAKGVPNPEAAIERGWWLVLQRPLPPRAAKALLALYRKEGERRGASGPEPLNQEALKAVASLLLNLDAALMRG